MKKGIYNLNMLKDETKEYNLKAKLKKNYENCIQLCEQNCYKLCLYDIDSTKYAIATIKIYVPECSNIQDYTDIITFNNYINEKNEVKVLPYFGIIPNYIFYIGNNDIFEQKYEKYKIDDYYNIKLKIPFIIDEIL